jgi:sulfate adenylyltransferase subunit 2
LDVASVQDAIDSGKVEEETGFHASRNALQTVSLLDGINEHKFDACLGGARRDEEKSRAKERVFSVRDSFGQWDPKNQRPELWHHLNGHIFPGENVRIFPLSNWTELDIWNYIRDREIELPSLYFAHEREVFERDGHLLSACEYIPRKPEEKVEKRMVRMRTIGDMTCTAAVLSEAVELNDVIAEISSASISERGARVDDQRSDAAMEKRKRGGYF